MPFEIARSHRLGQGLAVAIGALEAAEVRPVAGPGAGDEEAQGMLLGEQRRRCPEHDCGEYAC